MTVDVNLGFVLVANAQSQKEVTINNALTQLSSAMNSSLAISFTANARTLSASEYTRYHNFVCGTVSATGTLTVPLTNRNFVINNSANSGYAILVKGTSGAVGTVAASSVYELYCDGTNVVSLDRKSVV